jgi:hypothetical protein
MSPDAILAIVLPLLAGGAGVTLYYKLGRAEATAQGNKETADIIRTEQRALTRSIQDLDKTMFKVGFKVEAADQKIEDHLEDHKNV